MEKCEVGVEAFANGRGRKLVQAVFIGEADDEGTAEEPHLWPRFRVLIYLAKQICAENDGSGYQDPVGLAMLQDSGPTGHGGKGNRRERGSFNGAARDLIGRCCVIKRCHRAGIERCKLRHAVQSSGAYSR